MSILVEVLLLGRVVASTVDLMATGPGTAKLVIGRISVIAVESEVTLKETVKIVQRNSSTNTNSSCHTSFVFKSTILVQLIF